MVDDHFEIENIMNAPNDFLTFIENTQKWAGHEKGRELFASFAKIILMLQKEIAITQSTSEKTRRITKDKECSV